MKEKLTLGEIVKGTNVVFDCYRSGELWYDVMKQVGEIEETDVDLRTVFIYPDIQKIFSFPVPISDTGSGIFQREHKTINLMRWVRKHLDTIESYS